jgi:hypothetical protein
MGLMKSKPYFIDGFTSNMVSYLTMLDVIKLIVF